jgi:3-oxoacyl-[acyl-carrier-protein] synthase-3
MVGIASIGWFVPERKRTAEQIACDYRVSFEALQSFGLKSHAVAGEDDHPSTMGAIAARAALDAAGLAIDQFDLLIFTGMTRDFPAPWVGAFGVLHEMGANRAAGFDLNNRCTGLHDGLWVAASLVRTGAYNRVVVCSADRFDHLLGPSRRLGQISDTAYSAGAVAAVVSKAAGNEIAAFSHFTNPDLSLHRQLCPTVGGTRRGLDAAALDEGLHRWQNTMSLAQAAALSGYLLAADRHNITEVCQRAGFEDVDFLACSPLDVRAQIASLKAVGIGVEKTLFTLPRLGHMGPADSLVTLGVASATGRNLGRRVLMTTRSAVYSNALAIRADTDCLCIPAGGTGLDLDDWQPVEEARQPVDVLVGA